MTFQVYELGQAQADVAHIVAWLHERSPRGAASWLDAYDEMVARLEQRADTCGEADENAAFDLDVRQALFQTSRGRRYRALFIIEDRDVYLLRIRGAGQAPVTPNELGTAE